MNKERIAAYLGNGVAASQVASIVGCSPGYIAQLRKEPEFELLVQKHSLKLDGNDAAEEASIHMKYVGLEHKLVKAIGDNLENAEFRDQLFALKIVAERQDKAAIRKNPHLYNGNPGNGTQVYVSLTLPGHAIPSQPLVELNSRSEVVSIDNKPLAPMASTAVESMFKARRQQLEAQQKQIAQEI